MADKEISELIPATEIEDDDLLVLLQNEEAKKLSGNALNKHVSTIVTNKLFVTPQKYGAIGDGLTDDTQALQNAIDDAYANKKKLFFPTGKYLITLPLFIPPDMHIEGEQKDNTIIYKSTHNTHDSLPDGYKDSNVHLEDAVLILNTRLDFRSSWYRYLQIENITIQGCTEDNEHSQYGIIFPGSSDMVFSNVSVRNVSYGLCTKNNSIPVFLASFRDIYVLARNKGMAVSNNLDEYDNIFIEFTSEVGFFVSGNSFVGTVGISNAKGGVGVYCNSPFIGTISFEDCKNLTKYIEINGNPTIQNISAQNMTAAKAPKNYFIHSLGNSSPKIDHITLSGTSASIPVLIRIEGANSINRIGIIRGIGIANILQTHNSSAFNALYINDELQYKPYSPRNGMIYTLDEYPEIYQQGAWVTIHPDS